jgi:hypothetical protein
MKNDMNMFTLPNQRFLFFTDGYNLETNEGTLYGDDTTQEHLSGITFKVTVSDKGDLIVSTQSPDVEEDTLSEVAHRVADSSYRAYALDSRGSKVVLYIVSSPVAEAQETPPVQEDTQPTAGTEPTPDDTVSVEDKMADVLAMLGDATAEDTNAQDADDQHLPLEDRINALYAFVLNKAKAKDEPTALYVEERYEPSSTTLDRGNLYLNLLAVKELLNVGAMHFYFDDTLNKPGDVVCDLNTKQWSPAMVDGVEDTVNHANALIRAFRGEHYSAMFANLTHAMDTIAFNEFTLKGNHILSILNNEEEGDKSFEDNLREYILENTSDGSAVMATPDTLSLFGLNGYTGEAQQGNIEHSGSWCERLVYEIATEKMKSTKGFRNGLFLINDGQYVDNTGATVRNAYIVNPNKPLLYYTPVTTPFDEKPVLMMKFNVGYKFYKTATKLLRIERPE